MHYIIIIQCIIKSVIPCSPPFPALMMRPGRKAHYKTDRSCVAQAFFVGHRARSTTFRAVQWSYRDDIVVLSVNGLSDGRRGYHCVQTGFGPMQFVPEPRSGCHKVLQPISYTPLWRHRANPILAYVTQNIQYSYCFLGLSVAKVECQKLRRYRIMNL
jgi:hypothetical protein